LYRWRPRRPADVADRAPGRCGREGAAGVTAGRV